MPAADRLVHYFKVIWNIAGLRWTADNEVEIENFITDLKQEIRDEISADIGTAIDNHLSSVHKET